MVSVRERREVSRGHKRVTTTLHTLTHKLPVFVAASTLPRPQKNLIVIVAHLLAQQFMHVQRDRMCFCLCVCVCTLWGCEHVCVRSCHEIVVPVGRMHSVALTNILAYSQLISLSIIKVLSRV